MEVVYWCWNPLCKVLFHFATLLYVSDIYKQFALGYDKGGYNRRQIMEYLPKKVVSSTKQDQNSLFR